jgi:hypothetical protein
MKDQTPIWVRCAGAAGGVGGLIWGAAVVVMAMRPAGVPHLSYRATDDLTLPLELAVVLMVTGLLGFHRAIARRTGSLATAAVTVACSGVVFLFAGRTIMAFGNDAGWAVSFPGALAAMLGFALFGIAAWRADTAWRMNGLLLCATALLLVGFNTEDWRAWLGLPFGAAWVWLGGALLTTSLRWRAIATVPTALTLLLRL